MRHSNNPAMSGSQGEVPALSGNLTYKNPLLMADVAHLTDGVFQIHSLWGTKTVLTENQNAAQ